MTDWFGSDANNDEVSGDEDALDELGDYARSTGENTGYDAGLSALGDAVEDTGL